MSKYLINPVRAFYDIKDHYIKYIQTAFHTRYPSVEKEREELLNQDKVLYREPWIEPLPMYKDNGHHIEDLGAKELPGMSDIARERFKTLIGKGLINNPAVKLYTHQEEMLTKALMGKDCVITSGTGSGKTESFLLPLIANIVKEACSDDNTLAWKAKDDTTKYPGNFFWDASDCSQYVDLSTLSVPLDTTRLLQRPNEVWDSNINGRDAAIRGIIIYPMNALVEDQMTRLREALDSDDVQTFMDDPKDGLSGNRIFFGRYNGDTPGSGILQCSDDKDLREKIEHLSESMQEITDNAKTLNEWINEDGHYEERKGMSTFFQRHKGKGISSEMRSRMDMQLTPPDILITNYSMLAAILMRKSEDPIISATRKWLEKDKGKSNPTRVFHLIIDELHLNRGTAGTEMAYLTRLLIQRLGLSPDDRRLRILCSSASLSTAEGKKEESLKYLSDFFGREFKEENIIKGTQEISECSYDDFLPIQPFREITKLYKNKPEGFESEDSESIQLLEDQADTLSAHFNITDIDSSLSGLRKVRAILNHKNIDLKNRLLKAFEFGDSSRAIPFLSHENDNNTLDRSLSSMLFGVDDKDAAEGLVIARGLFDIPYKSDSGKDKIDSTLIPRLRFHYFFRNMDGLWADIDNVNDRNVGKLHASPSIKNPESGNAVLEILYCEDCGELFYTGKKLITYPANSTDPSIQLISSSPNIDSLPDSSPAIVVEQRNYQEYGIFWPNNEYDDADELNRELQEDDILLKHPEKDSRKAKYHCQWLRMILDKHTGQLLNPETPSVKALYNANRDRYVHGFFYDVSIQQSDDDISKIQALPSHCPYCHSERCLEKQNAIGRRSPIRGFRPGFTKGTQIFAKELFLQLPTAKTPKLVSFSDSREDAATVSNGIERNHYSDLLRECLFLFGKQDDAIIEKIRLVENEIAIAKENDDDDLLVEKLTEKKRLKALLNKEKNIEEILSTELITSPLYREIKQIGVNPNGCDVGVQTIETSPWYEINEHSHRSLLNTLNDQGRGDKARSIDPHIFKEVGGMLYAKSYIGLETAAIGYVSISKRFTDSDIIKHLSPKFNITLDEFKNIIDSTARILGEKHKHSDSEFASDGYTITDKNRVGKYINTVCKKHLPNASRQDYKDFKDCIYKVITESTPPNGKPTPHSGLVIDNQYIKICFASNKDKVYICPRCGRVHMHTSGGVCTFCNTYLDLNGYVIETAEDIWKRNYLMLNVIEGKKPHKLHCEEMTGQTDDQFLRQREFRDIITDKSSRNDSAETELIRKIKSIDILCVTTTLEVGVDIGSLQAVLLANMPPQRYNYQQRVGRGGRRGQSYSLILTLCRGRSHDLHYFNNPQQITGDEPPTPFLSMDRTEISRRMITKEVLYWAFKDIIDFQDDKSIHGEFGLLIDWDTNLKQNLQTWILNNLNEKISEIISCLDNNHFNEHLTWIKKQLTEEIDQRINNNVASCTYLSEYLAEAGLLPMYGMPTNAKELYVQEPRRLHQRFNFSMQKLHSVSRSIDQAISAFAPGSMMTKDKQVFTPIGFSENNLYIVDRKISGEKSRRQASHINRVFSEDRKLITCDNNSCTHFETVANDGTHISQVGKTCPMCGSGKIIETTIRTPHSFITDLGYGKDKKDDFTHGGTRNAIRTEGGTNGVLTSETKGRLEKSLSTGDFTWRISSREIEGQFYTTTYKSGLHTKDQKGIYSYQWIAKEFDSKTCKNIARLEAIGNKETIKLATHKVTNVVKLKPATPISGVKLDPFESVFINNKPQVKFTAHGVRAAYFSLAFILQRAIAEKIDIDPEEIDVADINRLANGLGVISLSDSQPNGSGFVNHLYQNFDEYVDDILNGKSNFFNRMFSDNHRKNCQEACYECLQVYRNMHYHGLLDWRLGIALLRLMTDENYRVGTDGNFSGTDSTKYYELNDWKQYATLLRDTYVETAPNCTAIDNCELPVIKMEVDKTIKYIFIVHPLWATDTSCKILAKACHQLGLKTSSDNVLTLDTFNLARRLSYCIEHIINS